MEMFQFGTVSDQNHNKPFLDRRKDLIMSSFITAVFTVVLVARQFTGL